MEFGKEYKKFGQDISPDRETIDRMKANVMSEVGRRRKPLPLGKIAVSCGSVAACAAIVITAAVLIPRTGSSNMTAGTSASSMAEISNEITTDTAADTETAAGDFSYNASTTDSDHGMTPSWNETADDVMEDDVAEDAEDIWTDDDMDISVPDNAFANATVSTDSSNKGDSVNADDRTDIIDDSGDNTTNAGDGGSTDSVTDEIIENDEVTPDNGDSNYDFDDSDDSIDFDHDAGDDGFDDEICDDAADDSSDDIYDGACDDSYDEADGLGLIDKAKFSGDRNRLMIILHDGSRRSYTLTYKSADMPEDLTSEYFIDEGAGTEYIAQLNGVYLRVNDLGNNFIALYRLDE